MAEKSWTILVIIKIINPLNSPVSPKVKIKMKKYLHVSTDKNKVDLVMLIWYKNEYKEKASNKTKNNKLILIKLIAHQNYRVIMNFCASNNRVLKYTRKNLLQMLGYIENLIKTVRNSLRNWKRKKEFG